MKNILLAFLAGVMACASVLAPIATIAAATPAAAQFEIDRETVHPGAVELVAPMPAPGETYANLTQIPIEERDTGSRVDFTEIVVAIFLAVVSIIGGLLTKALSFLPKEIRGVVTAWRLDQLGKTGFNNWAEKKANEIRVRGVTADLRSDALASMVRYGRTFAPEFVKNSLGGEGGLEERFVSRIDEYIDELLARWVRQKDNLAAVAPLAPVAPQVPSPAERAPPTAP